MESRIAAALALSTALGCGSPQPARPASPPPVAPAPPHSQPSPQAAPAPQASASPPGPAGRCVRNLDSSVGEATQFPYEVDFDIGRSSFGPGDRIVIHEVRGTEQQLEVDGSYLVRGEYELASADDARLGLSVTGTGQGICTSGGKRSRQTVSRGSGTFELAVRVRKMGTPHVSLSAGGIKLGDVYFGNRGYQSK